MSDSEKIHFGTLHEDGSVTDERTLEKTVIKQCPHLIIATEHHRQDGSCRCDDPDHKEMHGWEYQWDEEKKRWV